MREFLREKRKEKGLSLKAVSQEVGINEFSYCNIELGRRNPSVKVAKKIANVLGLDWTRFYEEE